MKFFEFLTRGIRELSPGCREATRLRSHALHEELSIPQRLGLRVHLLLCQWCRRYWKQIQFLRDAAHEYPDKIAGPLLQKLSDQARERIKQKLRDEAE